MAHLGIRKFQDLIGRTDLLRPADNVVNAKAKLLNLSLILKNALHLRPGVNIVGGSESQVRTILTYSLLSTCTTYKTCFVLLSFRSVFVTL